MGDCQPSGLATVRASERARQRTAAHCSHRRVEWFAHVGRGSSESWSGPVSGGADSPKGSAGTSSPTQPSRVPTAKPRNVCDQARAEAGQETLRTWHGAAWRLPPVSPSRSLCPREQWDRAGWRFESEADKSRRLGPRDRSFPSMLCAIAVGVRAQRHAGLVFRCSHPDEPDCMSSAVRSPDRLVLLLLVQLVLPVELHSIAPVVWRDFPDTGSSDAECSCGRNKQMLQLHSHSQ